MKQSILTFTKGMNTDLDDSMLSEGMYRYALNFRLGNYDSSSSNNIGALENVIGNVEVLSNPLSSGTIVGQCVVGKYIVLFYKGTSDIIYRLELNSDGTSISDFITVLDDSTSTSKFNFSTNSYISAVGNVETEFIYKVYWADGINPLRSINISDSAIPTYAGTEVSMLDHVPNVNFGIGTPGGYINIIDVEDGGSYTSGVVQYAYQLYNKNGTVSTISDVSYSTLLSSVNENEVGGSNIGEDISKSVRFKVIDIDSRYSRIRVFALYYEQFNSLPSVNVIYESSVTSSDIEIVDTGNFLYSITVEEFLTFNNTTYVPTAIESKDNILFSANIKEATFQSTDIDDWDSRAYTFQSNSTTLDLESVEGTSHEYIINSDSLVEWAKVPEDSDAITLSSKYRNSNNNSSRRFQYNSGQEGGEGPNIKYTFLTRHDTISNEIDTSSGTPGLATNADTNNTAKTNITGLQPGEVYRFGIVFYNKKGQVSYVKWISDIRIPHIETNHSPNYEYAGSGRISNNGIESHNLFVSFTIKNFPSDPNIFSWRIVRCKREFKDREVSYTGILKPTVRWDNAGTPLEDYTTSSFVDSDGIRGDVVNSKLWEFISPDILFNREVKNLENHKLIVVGYYTYDYSVNDNNATSGFARFFYSKGKELLKYPSVCTDRDIVDYEYIEDTSNTENIYILGSTEDEMYRPLVGTPALNDRRAASGLKLLINSNVFLQSGTSSVADTFRTDLPENALLYAYLVKNVEYSRYGGVSYEARFNNEYISYTSRLPIQTTTSLYSDYLTGDTYLKMFTYVNGIFKYNSNWVGDGSTQDIITFPIHSSINTDFRSDRILKNATRLADYSFDSTADQPISTMIQNTVEEGINYQPLYYNEDIGDLYTYNSVYSKTTDLNKYYVKPFDFDEESRISTKVVASEKKINGESIDSWTLFKPSNFIEVNTTYGDITNLLNFNNSLLFWQEKAFGVLAVNDRSLIQDNNIGQLSLGTGGVLERFDYISDSVGSSSAKSIDNSDSAVYWYDRINKQLLEYSSRLVYLDIEKGIRSYLLDKPVNSDPIVKVDYENREVIFSFSNSNALVYSQTFQAFIGDRSYEVKDMFTDFNNRLFSIHPIDSYKIYIHDKGNRGEFYGVVNSSEILIMFNKDYDSVKVFDVLGFPSRSLSSEVNIFDDTFDTLQVYNNYQNSGEYNLIKDGTYDSSTLPLHRSERIWTTFIPRNAVNKNVDTNPDIFNPVNLDKTQKFKARMRDNHLNIKMTYDNNSGNKFYIPYVKISYRHSNI